MLTNDEQRLANLKERARQKNEYDEAGWYEIEWLLERFDAAVAALRAERTRTETLRTTLKWALQFVEWFPTSWFDEPGEMEAFTAAVEDARALAAVVDSGGD